MKTLIRTIFILIIITLIININSIWAKDICFGSWKVSVNIDPMTDKISYEASTPYYGGVYKRMYYDEKDKTIKLNINTGIVHSADCYPTRVMFRVDKNEPIIFKAYFLKYGTWSEICLNDKILDQMANGKKCVVGLGLTEGIPRSNLYMYRYWHDEGPNLVKAYIWIKINTTN